MKKQRGQIIVEFALILPLFLLLVFGIFYSGMLFYDYSTLSNVARSAAREAAITETITEDDSTITAHYYDSANNAFVEGLVTHLYTPKSGEAFKIHITQTDGEPDDILVTIKMQLNVSFPLMDVVLPEEYQIKYHMKKDVKNE